MEYLLINTLPYVDEDFLFVREPVQGIGTKEYMLSSGMPIGSLYPPDAFVRLAPEDPGLVPPSLVGNISSLLIVDTPVRDAIAASPGCEMELLPLSIRNHKGRDVGHPYWIINPLDLLDCLSLDHCEVDRNDEGEILEIEKYALDSWKLEGAPDIFRLSENPETYVISRDLASRIAKLDPTNFLVDPLEIV